MSPRPRSRALSFAILAAAGALASLASCGGALPRAPQCPASPALRASPEGSPIRIEIRELPARPRLTWVTRDGDPAPALIVTVSTDLGSIETTALAALLEARLRAAGAPVEARAARSALRLRPVALANTGVPALLAAITTAFARPVAPGSPEMALVADRLSALKRNPLDAPDLVPIAACTGALGVAPGEPFPDATSAAFARDLDKARALALVAERTSIAAVGPADFTAAVASALTQSAEFPRGTPAALASPEASAPSATGVTGEAEAIGAFTSASIEPRRARITVAVSVGDPRAAAAAAERLGAPGSPLVDRLRALPDPFRLVEVAGIAHPRGGCVSAVIEPAARPFGKPIEPAAAFAAALTREEMGAELASPLERDVAERQVLSATDARDAAARAGWWALAGEAKGLPARWAVVLGVGGGAIPAGKPNLATGDDPLRQRFRAELERLRPASPPRPVAELASALERGQGELWVLLASPCGVAEEGEGDAGEGALATLAALEARREDDGVALEPFVTSDGIGVIARASLRDAREAPEGLARRVGSAAARALVGAPLTHEAVAAARASQLHLLEQRLGPAGASFAAFAAAMSPDHPSWLEPFGLFANVAGSGIEGLRLRRRALADGPLRLAVLANTDPAQARAAASAVDRWLRPSLGERACRPSAPAPTRPGRYEARLPDSAVLGEALIGAPVPAPHAPGRALAELTVAALNGEGGLLAGALQQGAVIASARLLGGARAPSLVIEVRAPAAAIAAAVAEVKLLLGRMPQALTDADLTRALAAADRRAQEALVDPRRRLADLWAGRAPSPSARPTLAALRAFAADTLREAALVVVESRPE